MTDLTTAPWIPLVVTPFPNQLANFYQVLLGVGRPLSLDGSQMRRGVSGLGP